MGPAGTSGAGVTDVSEARTPEYAGALPGSCKNLLDWSVGGVEMYEKPVAWTIASAREAAHAHGSLRTVLGYISAEIVEEACVHVPVPHQSVESLGRSNSRDPPCTRPCVGGCCRR